MTENRWGQAANRIRDFARYAREDAADAIGREAKLVAEARALAYEHAAKLVEEYEHRAAQDQASKGATP